MSEKLRESVMSLIQKQKVAMRPRWHFFLISAFATAGVLLLAISLLYIVSLALFFMQENGGWYAPVFGSRGWFVLMHSAPIVLLVLVVICALLLEILVRKYSFAYRAPLTLSLGGILVLVFAGGFMIAQTSLHRRLEFAARNGQIMPPMGMWYGTPMRPHKAADMHRGVIVADESGRLFLVESDGGGTTTVKITSKTRLPFGEDFTTGDMIVVIGDEEGTGTIRAFGIRKINTQ